MRANVQELFGNTVGILALEICIAETRLEAMPNREPHAHFPRIAPDGGMSEVLVIHHGVGTEDERGEHQGMGNEVVAQPYSKILQSTMKIPVVDGKQVRSFAIVHSHTNWEGEGDGELVRHAEIDTVNNSEE